jgi:hypothetical protein
LLKLDDLDRTGLSCGGGSLDAARHGQGLPVAL